MAKKVSKPKQEFVYYWYKIFKWGGNPFDVKYLYPVTDYLSGYQDERKKLNYFIIERQNLCHIYGQDGYGKTMLLMWLELQLKRYKQRLLVDFINKDVKFNDLIKMLIKPFSSFKDNALMKTGIGKSARLIGDHNLREIYESVYLGQKNLDFDVVKRFLQSKIKDKTLVLIVDDFDKLTKNCANLITMLINSDLDLQIVLSSTKDSLSDINKKDLLRIHLQGVAFESALTLISKRVMWVGGVGYEPFKESELKRLYEKANKNPQEFLVLCKKKAVKIALDKLNKGVEDFVEESKEKFEEKKEESKEKFEEKKEESKEYEIKVIDNVSSKSHNIKISKSGKREKYHEFKPVKVDSRAKYEPKRLK